jgi:hypothetical protein
MNKLAHILCTLIRTPIAVNDIAENEKEWIVVARFGIYPNKEGRQRINATTCKQVIDAFHAEREAAANAAENWAGKPIFIGHPDVIPKAYPDDRARGSVLDLKIEGKKLLAQVAWNSLGRHNKAEGEHLYPSVAWHFNDVGEGVIEPADLVSVGLTNRPNMKDLPPIVALNEEDQPDTPEDDMKKELAEKLRRFLALNEDADQDAMLTAINDCMEGPEQPRTLRSILWLPEDASADTVKAALATRAAEIAQRQAELDDLTAKLATEQAATAAVNERATALEAEVTTLKATMVPKADLEAATAKLTAINEAHRDELIRVAINEGRATPAEKDALIATFAEDFTKATETLKARKPALNTKPLTFDREAGRVAANAKCGNGDKRKTAVNACMKADNCDFATAWAKTKKLHPELFATEDA